MVTRANVAGVSIRLRILKDGVYVDDAKATAIVAGVSIRLRILKVIRHKDIVGDELSLQRVDPGEETERMTS